MNTSFLGRGWSFPPVFDLSRKGVVMVENEENIRHSLHAILATMSGERIMNFDFGCQLEHRLFDAIDSNTRTYIYDAVKTSILRYEPRIDVNAISLVADEPEGVVAVTIDYTVRATNSRSNYVYPYYKLERSIS